MMYEEATIAAKYVIKTAYIVRVIEVHPENQTVDVAQDSFEFCTVDGGTYLITNEFGVNVPAESLAPFIITEVPVQQLRWGKFSVQCMPQVNDTGLLVVMTDDISRWIKEGSCSAAGSGAKFSVYSSVFIPFITNELHKAENYPEPDTDLIIKGENVSIKLTDNGTDANISITGDTTITGDVTIDGNLSVTGKITSDDDIVADGISVKEHTHTIPAGGIVTVGSETTQQTQSPTEVPAPDTQGA